MNRTTVTVLSIVVAALVIGCLVLVVFISAYNTPMNLKLGAQEQLGVVAVMLQRQADVVLQAQGAFGTIAGLDNAQILGFVAEAQALSGKLKPYCNKATGTCTLPDDPIKQLEIIQAMNAYEQKSAGFIAYVQQHPQLRTADAFDTFMVAVEGSANRVSTERRTLQLRITALKSHCLNIPGSIFCGMRGITGNEFQYFEAAPGAENMPAPNFPTPVMP